MGVYFQLVEHIATLSKRTNHKGENLNMELNLVKWNGREVAEFDIREWDDNHNQMTYGIKLDIDQFKSLCDCIISLHSSEANATMQQAIDSLYKKSKATF